MLARTTFHVVRLCALAGRGEGPAAEVAGAVTLDGEPIETGTVVFAPAGGGGLPVGGPIQGGECRLVAPRVPAEGIYEVEVRGSRYSNCPPAPDASPAPAEAVAARFNANPELRARFGPAGGTRNFQAGSKLRD